MELVLKEAHVRLSVSKRSIRSTLHPTVKYLSLLLCTGMFLHVVCHGWSSHVSFRMSVRLWLLHSESRRASRALGAARPSYLSVSISMWMLQLFGRGIFPHTGFYQSGLTGHCPHSITEGPGVGKKNLSQATDVQPETVQRGPPPHPNSLSAPHPQKHRFLFS